MQVATHRGQHKSGLPLVVLCVYIDLAYSTQRVDGREMSVVRGVHQAAPAAFVGSIQRRSVM